MKIKLILLLFFTFIGVRLYGQQFSCGFDKVRNDLFKANPSLQQKERDTDKLLYEIALRQESRERGAQTPLYIPIVVHVIHQNGPENLPDSVIINAVVKLNHVFANTGSYYDSAGVDIGIRFCLASVDPYGNPTTGITRVISPLTDLSIPGHTDLAMKNLDRWDPHLYLNVWIIQYTGSSTIAGYATYPVAMGSGEDGVVIQYNYLTASLFGHEVGHYLGLYHTFEGGCTNNNCQLDGDQVCDTPPDATNDYTCPNNSCSTEMNDTSGFNPFTGDMNDSPNYMDYTNCPLLFTTGQSTRMNAALINIRSMLLQSNGCGANPGGPIPVASFASSPSCNGVSLTNTSTNSVGAQWDFNSDGLLDNSGNTVNFNPPSTGYYTVTMYATGIGGTDTITQTVFAQHYPYQNYPLVNGYSGLILGPNGTFKACAGSAVTFQGEPGMVQYIWSNGDTTQNTTFIADSLDFTISLTTIDSAGLTWTNCYPIHVTGEPAPIPPIITTVDSVFCIGQPMTLNFTWSPIVQTGTLQYLQANSPPYSWIYQNGFTSPTFTTTTYVSNYFQVHQTDTNGCTASSPMLNLSGMYGPYPGNISVIGNSLYYGAGIHWEWYLDNVPIPNSDTSWYTPTQDGCYKVRAWWYGSEACATFSLDSVCIVTTGIPENAIDNMTLSPNPVTSHISLSFPADQEDIMVKILDIAGREVRSMLFSGKEFVIDRENLSSGVYFIQVTDRNSYTISRKIIFE